jgi:dipeptidase
MNKTALILLLTIGVLAGIVPETAVACTSLIVTASASTDDSVFITYTCDAEFHPYLEIIPAADHQLDSFVAPARWVGRIESKVKQVAHTYAVIGSSSAGLMNDQQVAIGETTFGALSCATPRACWAIPT